MSQRRKGLKDNLYSHFRHFVERDPREGCVIFGPIVYVCAYFARTSNTCAIVLHNGRHP